MGKSGRARVKLNRSLAFRDLASIDTALPLRQPGGNLERVSEMPFVHGNEVLGRRKNGGQGSDSDPPENVLAGGLRKFP